MTVWWMIWVLASPVSVGQTLSETQPSGEDGVVRDDAAGDDALAAWWGGDKVTGDWFGARSDLAEIGFHLEPWMIIDWSQNWKGGLNTQGSAFRHLFGVDLTVETEPLFGLPGGTFFVQYYNHNGPDATAEDVGDFQVFSNIDADGRSQVAELWYEQWFGEYVRLKVGKVEANSEFAYAENGVEFIHPSAGFPPTILAFPSYPDPAMSLNLFAYPTSWSYIGVGWYDGALQNGFNTGELGPSMFGHQGYFWITETGVTWDGGGDRLSGRFALGGWLHTEPFEVLEPVPEDEEEVPVQIGTEGWYAILDQTLWCENPDQADDDQGISMYASYAYADPDVSEVTDNINFGAVWRGVIPTRDDDILGFGWNYVRFTGSEEHPPTGYEAAYEWFYRFELAPGVSLKPDVQYIHNPGGQGNSHAVVGTLRLEFAF